MSIAVYHNPNMKRIITAFSLVQCISLAVLITVILLTNAAAAADSKHAVTGGDDTTPLSFKSVIGTWTLKYSGNYGYTFSLHANYRAMVALYLNRETIVFKGVYTIEDGNKLKINIYEMKDEHRNMRNRKGFVKAKSSYFLFDGHRVRKGGRDSLHLRPLAIIIDGNNSEGYFEPLIKLAKTR